MAEKMFWDKWLNPPKSDEKYAGAYVKKRPMSEWYNYLIGPTGYEGGFSWNAANPTSAGIESVFKGQNPFSTIDWRKAVSGGKTGFGYGTSISPGWGSLIGGGVGTGLGATFIGDKDYNSGMAASAEGRATGDWGKWNELFKILNTGMNIYGAGRGGGVWGSGGSGPTQIGYANKLFGNQYGGNYYDTSMFDNMMNAKFANENYPDWKISLMDISDRR